MSRSGLLPYIWSYRKSETIRNIFVFCPYLNLEIYDTDRSISKPGVILLVRLGKNKDKLLQMAASPTAKFAWGFQ